MLRAVGDAELRAVIGRQAREAVRAHDVRQTVAAYDAALRAVVGHRPSRAGARPATLV
jgi:hypothetical protein